MQGAGIAVPVRGGSKRGIAALGLSIAGCLVFPVIALILGLFAREIDHGGGASPTMIILALGLGTISVVVSVVLAIVVLAKGEDGRVAAIVAIVLDVLSIPSGIFAGVMAFVFATGNHG